MATMRVLAAALCALLNASSATARKYEALSTACQDAVAISGDLGANSVAACEAKCDAQAAGAAGSGACRAVDTDGWAESHCWWHKPVVLARYISYAVQLSPSRVAQTDSGGRPPETSTVPNRDSVTARGRQESMKEGASVSFQLPPRSVDLAMA